MINSLSAAGRLVVTLKKQKHTFNEQKMLQMFFQFFLKNKTKYNHFAITYKTELF